MLKFESVNKKIVLHMILVLKIEKKLAFEICNHAVMYNY